MTTKERHELGARMLELHEQWLDGLRVRRHMAFNAARVRLLNIPLDQLYVDFTKEKE